MIAFDHVGVLSPKPGCYLECDRGKRSLVWLIEDIKSNKTLARANTLRNLTKVKIVFLFILSLYLTVLEKNNFIFFFQI